jgi:hypothetical protein
MTPRAPRPWIPARGYHPLDLDFLPIHGHCPRIGRGEPRKIKLYSHPARSAGRGFAPLRSAHAKTSHGLTDKTVKEQGSLRVSRGPRPLGNLLAGSWGGAPWQA